MKIEEKEIKCLNILYKALIKSQNEGIFTLEESENIRNNAKIYEESMTNQSNSMTIQCKSIRNQ